MTTIDIYHKDLPQMSAFLGTMEAVISPWGGRRFRVRGDLNAKALALKDIVKIVEGKCGQAGRVSAPLSTIAAIKRLDSEGAAALRQASFFKRILTYLRQFFGNIRCYKYRTLDRLNGLALQNEDHRFLFEEFNRQPVLQEAAVKLMQRLTELAQTARKAQWSPTELQVVANELYQRAPQKLQAILALPDNGYTTPLKTDLHQLILEGQRLAAERQRLLQRPQQPIIVVSQQLPPTPVVQQHLQQTTVLSQAPQPIETVLPLQVEIPELERLVEEAPTPKSPLIQKEMDQESLQQCLNEIRAVIKEADNSRKAESEVRHSLKEVIDKIPKEMFGSALRNSTTEEIQWCLEALNADSYLNQEGGETDDFKKVVDLYKALNAEQLDECFPEIFLDEGEIVKFVSITPEQDFIRTTKKYLLLEVGHDDSDETAALKEDRQSLVWAELMSKYRYDAALTIGIFDYLKWDPLLITDIIDQVRKMDYKECYPLLAIVKERKEEVYILVLRNLLFLLEKTVNEDTFLCRLSDEDYEAMIRAVPSFITEVNKMAMMLEADSDNLAENEMVVQLLFSRLWKLLYTDYVDHYFDYSNRVRLASVNETINSVMKSLVLLSPDKAAKVYASVFERWGSYFSNYSFPRQYLFQKRDLEQQLEFAFERLVKTEFFLEEVTPKQKFEFGEFLNQYTQGKRSIFSFMFIQQNLGVAPDTILGVNESTRENALDNLCYMVPEKMFGFILSAYPIEIMKECLGKLEFDTLVEVENPHQGDLDKIVSLYNALDEEKRLQVFPDHVLTEEGFAPRI